MPQPSPSNAPRQQVIRASLAGRTPSKVPARDGRSPQGVALRRAREALIAHVGGRASATQLVMIERAAMLQLHLAAMDEAAMEKGGFSEGASKQYLAWSAHLSRLLRALGLEGKPSSPAATGGLAAYLKGRREQAAKAAA